MLTSFTAKEKEKEYFLEMLNQVIRVRYKLVYKSMFLSDNVFVQAVSVAIWQM